MSLTAPELSKVSEKYNVSEILGLVLPILGIVASILIAAMVIWPKVGEIKNLQVSNAQDVKKADSLQQKIVVLEGLNEDKLEEQLIAAEQLLPSEKNTFPFLSQVEGASVTSGIVLNKVEVLSSSGAKANSRSKVVKKAGSTGPTEDIRLRISSDYQSLLQFLTSLSLFSRVTTVNDIKIDTTSADGAQLNASFTVNGYWKALPESLGSVESSVVSLTAGEKEILEDVTKPEVSEAPELPKVPVGRGNLFTPF